MATHNRVLTQPQSTPGFFDQVAHKYPDAIHTLGSNHEEWARRARLDWEIKTSDCAFTVDGGKSGRLFPGKRVFFRSDTEEPLAVVGKKFQPVQPKDILDFYGEVSERYGFKLAIAGEVDGGRKIWAMAETPHEYALAKGDEVKGGLFVMTACDGSLSTQGFFTSFRLWCMNQLPVIHRHAKKGKTLQVFRCTHGAKFTTARVERDLEVMQLGWENFQTYSEALSDKKVTDQQAINFLARFFHKGEDEVLTPMAIEDMRDNSVMKKLLEVYKTGEGQKTITGTAWGVVNAVTRYIDHETRSRDGNVRVRKAWIEGSRTKAGIFDAALQEFVPKVLVG